MNPKFAEWCMESTTHYINVIEGSIRVGKDYMATRMFIERIKSFKGDAMLFMISAVNIKQAYRIIGQYILDYCGISAQRTTYGGSPAISLYVNDILYYIIFSGGSNNGSDTEIQGLTLGGIYLTEINKLQANFINQCMERLGSDADNAFLFATLNPLNENNFFYKKFLDMWLLEEDNDPAYINYMHVTLDDSPYLTPKAIQYIKKGKDPESVYYKRDILGLRVDPSGTLYEVRDYNKINVTDYTIYKSYIVVCDPGETISSTSMIVMGLCYNAERNQPEVHILKEYYHLNNSMNDMEKKTPDIYAGDYVAFTKDAMDMMYKAPVLMYSDGDSTFINMIRKNMNAHNIGNLVLKYVHKDKLEERVEVLQNILYSGKLRIGTNCPHCISDLNSSVLDEKKYETTGKILPVKAYDRDGHKDSLDCISYGVNHYLHELNM